MTLHQDRTLRRSVLPPLVALFVVVGLVLVAVGVVVLVVVDTSASMWWPNPAHGLGLTFAGVLSICAGCLAFMAAAP